MKHEKQSSNSMDLDNSNESGKTEELIEAHKVEDTPFTIIKYGEKWFLTMGKYRLTEPGTKKEAEAEVHNTSWNRIMQIMMIVAEEQIKNDKLKSNKPN